MHRLKPPLLAAALLASACAPAAPMASAPADAPQDAAAMKATSVAALLSYYGLQPALDRIPRAGIPSVPPALAAVGVSRFTVADWGGAPVPVWLLRPASAKADAPVMFVLHGVGRDADRYIAEWVEIATAEGLIIVVPEFTRNDFPGTRAYNFGNVFNDKGGLNPRASWSYSAIDQIFSAVVAKEQLTASRYTLFGHSAGAQFAHRFALLGVGTKVGRVISANAGSYTWPAGPNPWPFGVSDLDASLWKPAAAFASPLLLMLGTADNDPNYPSLPRKAEATAQGPHRLARGQAFFNAAQGAAKQAGTGFNWSCALIPDIGHDNGGMAPYAIRLLRAETLPTGGDCLLMKKPAG